MELNEKADQYRPTRRGLLAVFAATAVTCAPRFANAAGFLRGAGNVRRISMYSGRSGESIDMIYCVDGRYVKDALSEITFFMRDLRENKSIPIDYRTVDILAASHALLRVDEPFMLLSGYRTPKTNAMLRSESRHVAKASLHMKGEAADVRLKNRSVSQVAQAAQACSAGGIGRYYRSNFVHMDCGPIRTWTS